ncbi:MAG: response regulator, partial [Hyphomicrobiaceae bacterium]
IYVNRAFCRAFAVDGKDVIGRPFTPVVLQSGEDRDGGQDDRLFGSNEAPVRRRFTEELETAAGPRWFSWEEQTIRNSETGAIETQRIGRDISDQRQVEKTLNLARKEAEAASEAKSRFLAVMSHEIRTPLGGIMGMTGLLDGTKLSAEQKTYASAIKESAKSLLTIIDEILDFSKIEAGRVALDKAPFKIDHLVRGVAELLAPRAWEKKLEFSWDIDPDLPQTVIGDEHRIRQILMNLVGNAIKFTSEGGVRLSVMLASEDERPADGRALKIDFAVTDTGIGLTSAQREKIFTEFEQADTTTTRRFGGTGLGLTISRRLARSMDGDITIAASGSDGVGTTGSAFTLTLHLETAESKIRLRDAWLEKDQGTVGACNILIASGRTIEASAMARTLSAFRHHCTTVAPQDAVAVAKAASRSSEPVNAVISDTSVAAALRRRICKSVRDRLEDKTQFRSLIVIDSADRARLSDFREEGFAAYLMRPVRPASLLSQLAQPGPDTSDISNTSRSLEIGKRASAPTPADVIPITNASSPGTSNGRPRVLLAEDNPVNALLARRILEDMDIDVVHVENGQEAFEAVTQSLIDEAGPFDLVLMDLHMPEMDGITACEHIRALDDEASTEARKIPPIIALTANAFPEDRQRCIGAGMSDYLTKPFERSQLAAMIDQWCHGVEPADPHGSLTELARA